MMKRKMYVIAGPTASGKSDLAVLLAQHLRGEVINADSLQVYADLQVLSARPQERDMHGVPHHLYGFMDAYSSCSVNDWLLQVRQKTETIKMPVFVGGTGMYISALIEGISPIPDIDPQIRERVRQMDMAQVCSLVQECSATDPQRLKRALEVQLTTGKPISYFQNLPKVKQVDADFQVIFVNPPRDILYDRCNRRFDKMIELGAIDEVKELIAKNASGGVLKAIGVSEIKAYLAGEFSLDIMRNKAMQATRHYAKRQLTWFRNQLKNPIVLSQTDVSSLFDELQNFL